jgi:hypothetical protein
VLIVKMEGPDALVTEDGLNCQVGGAAVAVDPFSVMLLHASATLWLNPATGVIVTVAVADFPAEIEAGDTADAETANPAPAPDNAISCGLPGALSLTAILALRDPVAVGVNVAFTVHLPAVGKELPQLLL